MPVGRFVRKRALKRRAGVLQQMSRKAHYRAALIGRRALRAGRLGYSLRSIALLKLALKAKGRAARLGLRAREHAARARRW